MHQSLIHLLSRTTEFFFQFSLGRISCVNWFRAIVISVFNVLPFACCFHSCLFPPLSPDGFVERVLINLRSQFSNWSKHSCVVSVALLWCTHSKAASCAGVVSPCLAPTTARPLPRAFGWPPTLSQGTALNLTISLCYCNNRIFSFPPAYSPHVVLKIS